MPAFSRPHLMIQSSLLMLMALWLPVAMTLAAAPRSCVASWAHAPPRSMVVANSWQEAQKKRKELERKQYEEIAERAAKAEQEKAAAAAARAEEERAADLAARQRAAAYQDGVDLYRPGGVMRQKPMELTREMMQDSRKTTSPALAADERVKEALQDVSGMPPAEGAALLAERIAEARDAGTNPNSPNVKKARALQTQLETAAAASQQDAAIADPQKDVFDALFGSGFAPPDDSMFDLD